jgi:hypothetical protein
MSEKKPIHAKPSLYAFYFDIIKEIGLKYGYNIVLHGSMNRDLDLIAIPWVDVVGDVDKMIDEISLVIGGNVLLQNRSVNNLKGDRYYLMPHGRTVYVININRDFEQKHNGFKTEIKEYSDPMYYIDISVMPCVNNIYSKTYNGREFTKKMIEARKCVDTLIERGIKPTYDIVAKEMGIGKTSAYHRLRGYRHKMNRNKIR